jgi:hypothetical protein
MPEPHIKRPKRPDKRPKLPDKINLIGLSLLGTTRKVKLAYFRRSARSMFYNMNV